MDARIKIVTGTSDWFISNYARCIYGQLWPTIQVSLSMDAHTKIVALDIFQKLCAFFCTHVLCTLEMCAVYFKNVYCIDVRSVL